MTVTAMTQRTFKCEYLVLCTPNRNSVNVFRSVIFERTLNEGSFGFGLLVRQNKLFEDVTLGCRKL